MRLCLVLLALPALLTAAAPASLTPQARVLLALNYTAWHAQAAQGVPECSWEGVTCEGGAVTGVHIGGYRCHTRRSDPSGTLPAAWSQLTALRNLSIECSDLSGTLPPEWSALAALQRLNLYNNNLSGTLPPKWSELAALQELTLAVTNLSGTLLPEWSKLAALRRLDLYNNNLSGTLPPEWSELAALQELLLFGNNFGGRLPDPWRHFCVHKKFDRVEVALYFGGRPLFDTDVVPSGMSGRLWTINGFSDSFNSVKPEHLLAYALKNRDQWRTNACLYPGAGDYLIAMLVLISFALACMLAAACWLRCRPHRAGGAPALAQMLCVPRLAGRRRLQAVLRGLKLALLFVRPAIVVVDVVSDCMTIQQVWSADPQSWAGPVLLSCVFLPEVLTALCLAVATAVAAAKLGGSSGCDLARPAWPARPAAGWRPWLAWVLAVLKQPALLAEHAVLSAHARSGGVPWRVACAVLSWPLLLLTTPLLLPFGVIDEGSLQRLAPHEAAFITWRPARAATLWSWCSGGIEAPVSGGLLLMLLLLGVRSRNSYVIERPAFLYLSLSFSLVHVLLFVWDMLSLWATSRSRAHWAKRMRRPFVPAVAVTNPAPGTAAGPASAAPHAQGQAKDVTPVAVAAACV